MRKLFLLGLIVLLMFAVAGCGGSKGADPADDYVMDEPMPSGGDNATKVELTFTPEDIQPNTVTLKPGEKIVWIIKNNRLSELRGGNR